MRARERLPLNILVLLWAAAFGLRMFAASSYLHYAIALDDMFQYDMLARSLVQGQGYRWYSPADLEILRPYMGQFLDYSRLNVPENGLWTSFRAPGYPFFLASIYAFSGVENRLFAARLVQCALTALLAPLSALLAARLSLNRRAQVISGGLMAAYPLLVLYPIGLASENLFIPLFAASSIALLDSRQKRSLWQYLFAGALLGMVMLTRSVAAIFVLLAALWVGRNSARKWSGAALVVGTAFIVCLPWAVRNSMGMGQPAFVESSLGYQMYIGYHPSGTGSFVSAAAVEPLTILDDAARNRYCFSRAVQFITSDPLEAGLRVIRRVGHFMAVEDRELLYFYTNGYFGTIPALPLVIGYLVLVLPWIGVCLLATFGLLFLPDRSGRNLILLMVTGYTLPHLLIIAEPRFHLALVPVLIPAAVLGVQQLVARRSPAPSLERNERAAGWLTRVGLLACLLSFLLVWILGYAGRWQSLLAVFAQGGDMLRFYY